MTKARRAGAWAAGVLLVAGCGAESGSRGAAASDESTRAATGVSVGVGEHGPAGWVPAASTESRPNAVREAPGSTSSGSVVAVAQGPIAPAVRVPVEDPTGRALCAFHEALRRVVTDGAQARITFFGASHVASDAFTGQLRARLQLAFGDAGHGFVLPVRPWRTYNHQGVDILRDRSNERRWRGSHVLVDQAIPDRYGLAGVYVESSARDAFASISTATDTPVGGAVSRFEIWFLDQPGGGAFDVAVDGASPATVTSAAVVPAADYETFDVPDGPHRLELRVRGDGLVRIFGVLMARDVPGVTVDALGINGARARYQLLWEPEIFRTHLRRRDPHLVVLAYGTNESADEEVPIELYEATLREVVARVHGTLPSASCLLLGPTDRPERARDAPGGWVDRPRTQAIVDVQRRVAFDTGCGFFDLVAFMGGARSMVAWAENDPPLGARDHVHLTHEGYVRLGEVLLEALLAGAPDLATVVAAGSASPVVIGPPAPSATQPAAP